MDELRKKGLAKMNEVYGWEMPDMPGEYFALTVDHLFGSIWTRPGLSMRDRRMMLLGVLAAQGMEELMEVQATAILHNEEMTREELREIAIFLTHYVGFPLGSKVDGALKRVVAKRKKAEEKGAAETRRTTSTTPSRCTWVGTSMTSRYAALSRDELATLVPELLLIGQLIDRSGMAHCISAWGREEMLQIAIEEWAASSPLYTKRMQKALNYEGVDIFTLFKGLQLDIGAPPQFMDFRYVVHDRWHGEFYLDHCGALLDVEPMGEEYVRGMCHDIEDPTFDATALATNRKAQVRPIHRPPRASSDQHPHCRWTVIIDESYPEVPFIPAMDIVAATHAHSCELDPIDPNDEGMADYSGPLLSDVDFGAFSHSALVRIADEVCLQMHLLVKSFTIAVEARAKDDAALARSIRTKQLIGIAGVAAERIHKALKLPGGPQGALRVLELHPLLNPAAYVSVDVDPDFVHVRRSPAYEDGSWISLVSPVADTPLQAIVAGRRPAPARRGQRHRVRLDRARHRNRHRRKGVAGGCGVQVQRRGDVGVRGPEVAAAHGGVKVPVYGFVGVADVGNIEPTHRRM